MGGHQCGEIASGMVVEALSAVAEGHSPYAYLGAVREALMQVNQELVATAGAGATGSTVVTLLAAEGHFAVLWAGDSRAYLRRNGALLQLTRDHSVVQDLVEAGSLRPEEAQSHRQSHVITRAVGASAHLVLDMRNGPILAGDRYLLCSDGLTTHLSDKEIQSVLDEGNLEVIVTRLLNNALERGGSDNISIIVIDAAQDTSPDVAFAPKTTA
jgi:serine/threonine protein phosphatase PrpC